MQDHERGRNLAGLLWVTQTPVGGAGQQTDRGQGASERCFANHASVQQRGFRKSQCALWVPSMLPKGLCERVAGRPGVYRGAAAHTPTFCSGLSGTHV